MHINLQKRLITMTYEKLKPYMAGAEHYGNHTRRLSPAFIDEKETWYRISKRPEFENAESLARLLSEKSHLFENETEKVTTVRNATVVIGITQFHHIQAGFVGPAAEKAWRVFRAFQMSDCSEEVRLLVLKVAATLHLGEAYRSRDEI